jgi:hypothetical protein
VGVTWPGFCPVVGVGTSGVEPLCFTARISQSLVRLV